MKALKGLVSQLAYTVLLRRAEFLKMIFKNLRTAEATFLRARCPSRRTINNTNSVKALEALR